MPIDFDAFESDNPDMGARRASNGGGDTSGNPWEQVFSPHPEGGGAFGGRDNALVKLVGFLRAKSVPFEAGRLIALTWNREYCQPPLLESDVLDKVARAWAEWIEGGHEDAKPDPVKTELEFLTWEQMEEAEEAAGQLTWLMPDILPSNGLVYLSAPPAGGKSWLLGDLVRCLAHGGNWIGKFPVEATPCLYIDEEMGVRKMMPRLRKLGVKNPKNFRYTNQAGVKIDNLQHMTQILALCQQEGIPVVIIDTLTRVHSKDENDNSQMRKLFEYLSLLLKAGLLVIIAHHDRKGGQGESTVGHERMRGAGEIAASADMTYSVDKRGGYFHLECTKSRLVSEDDTISVDFLIEDSEDKLHTTLRPLTNNEKGEYQTAKNEGKITERIIAALEEGGPMSVTAITKVVRGASAAIISALAQMEQTGQVVTEDVGGKGGKVLYHLNTGR